MRSTIQTNLKPITATLLDELTMEQERDELARADRLILSVTKDDLCAHRKLPFLLVSTLAGYQLIHRGDIVYFEYDATRRRWTGCTRRSEKFVVKRGTTADRILSMDHQFVQANLRYIVNIYYLNSIESMHCKFNVSVDTERTITFSRNFFKDLMERIESF